MPISRHPQVCYSGLQKPIAAIYIHRIALDVSIIIYIQRMWQESVLRTIIYYS